MNCSARWASNIEEQRDLLTSLNSPPFPRNHGNHNVPNPILFSIALVNFSSKISRVEY